MVAFGSLAAVASADGPPGSPEECEDGPTDSGNVGTAPDGFVIDGVCIKSGSLHTGVITESEFDCYNIAGLGTGEVTVTKDFDGPDCQDVSHLDLIVSEVCEEDCEPCQEDCDPPTDPCVVDPDSCIPVTEVCVDGEVTEAPENEATGDCDPVRLCVDGESITVTEFDAENDPDLEDADPGSCVPGDEPPPSTPPPVEEVEEVVEEQPVEEVLAVVEEVAALPSAGYGDTASGSSFAWALALAAGLVSLGGASMVAVRRIR